MPFAPVGAERETALTRAFLTEALGERAPEELDTAVAFIVKLTTSFAERTTDEGTAGAALLREADLLCDMLVAQFGIADR